MKNNKPKTKKEPIPCNNCGKPAKYNLQGWYFLYKVNEDGLYSQEPVNDWDGGLNNHYCDECAKEEGIIPFH